MKATLPNLLVGPSKRTQWACWITLAPLLVLFLGLWISRADAGPAPQISSVRVTTNGLALSWANRDSNTAYSVQIRDSVSAGGWRDAPTRYAWPTSHTHWMDALSTLRAPRFYQVRATPKRSPQRGQLLLAKTPRDLTTNQVQSFVKRLGAGNYLQPTFPVRAWVLHYETIDPFGFPILASALLMAPSNAPGPLPLVSCHHGGDVNRSEAPSRLTGGESDAVDYWAPAAFATAGYVAVAPDYLGLGDGPGFQRLFNAKSTATCTIDALRAVRTFCATNQLSLDSRLFLFGFSQGGQVTMAVQRELERFHTNEFTVTASVPCSGVYDLGGVMLRTWTSDQSDPTPWQFFVPILLAGYLDVYDLADSLEELLAEPWRRRLPAVLNAATLDWNAIAGLMPTSRDVFSILRPDFQADFRVNPENPLRRALAENSVYDWTPIAPVRLLHCGGDQIVPFANSEVTFKSFTTRNACCVELIDPGAPAKYGHDLDCYNASLRTALEWFAQFR